MTPFEQWNSTTHLEVRNALERAARDQSWRTYHGPAQSALSEQLGLRCQREFTRFCSSGTLAVELALRSLHLRSDDEVLLSAYDFPGNFRAIEDVGAKVVLCDPSDGWCLNVESLEAASGPLTRALIVSHLHGQLAPMDLICRWASNKGIAIIEDACQCHGATIDGRPAGSWGDLSVLSFGGSKLISAGRGGAVLTNSPQLSQRMTVFCERGNDAFAMSELQSIVCLAQYRGLDHDNQIRANAALELIEFLTSQNDRSSPFTLIPVSIGMSSQGAYYKFGIRVQLNNSYPGTPSLPDTMLQCTRQHRDRIVHLLRDKKIEVGEGFRGFFNKSTKRYRSVSDLKYARLLSASTIVLHHSHLLDPFQGTTDISNCIECFQRILETNAE